MPEDIIITWGLFNMHHPMTLHIPLNCIAFLNREDSKGTDTVVISFHDQ